MKLNVNMFHSKRVLYGDDLSNLAEYLGISRQTLSAKISDNADFKKEEIRKIIIRYKLTPEETFEIFGFNVEE